MGISKYVLVSLFFFAVRSEHVQADNCKHAGGLLINKDSGDLVAVDKKCNLQNIICQDGDTTDKCTAITKGTLISVPNTIETYRASAGGTVPWDGPYAADSTTGSSTTTSNSCCIWSYYNINNIRYPICIKQNC